MLAMSSFPNYRGVKIETFSANPQDVRVPFVFLKENAEPSAGCQLNCPLSRPPGGSLAGLNAGETGAIAAAIILPANTTSKGPSTYLLRLKTPGLRRLFPQSCSAEENGF